MSIDDALHCTPSRRLEQIADMYKIADVYDFPMIVPSLFIPMFKVALKNMEHYLAFGIAAIVGSNQRAFEAARLTIQGRIIPMPIDMAAVLKTCTPAYYQDLLTYHSGVESERQSLLHALTIGQPMPDGLDDYGKKCRGLDPKVCKICNARQNAPNFFGMRANTALRAYKQVAGHLAWFRDCGTPINVRNQCGV